VKLTLTVAASAVSVRRWCLPELFSREGSETKVEIEGRSVGPAHIEPRDTLLLVSAEKGPTKAAGYAHGGKTPWIVDCELPRCQFEHLLTMIFADRLAVVEMAFDHLRWQKGTLLEAEFTTHPLPSESGGNVLRRFSSPSVDD
jgi:hypothetical protein